MKRTLGIILACFLCAPAIWANDALETNETIQNETIPAPKKSAAGTLRIGLPIYSMKNHMLSKESYGVGADGGVFVQVAKYMHIGVEGALGFAWGTDEILDLTVAVPANNGIPSSWTFPRRTIAKDYTLMAIAFRLGFGTINGFRVFLLGGAGIEFGERAFPQFGIGIEYKHFSLSLSIANISIGCVFY